MAAYGLDYRLTVDVNVPRFNGAFVQNGNDVHVRSRRPDDGPLRDGQRPGGCPGDTLMRLFGFDEARAPASSSSWTTTVARASCSLINQRLAPAATELEVNGFGNHAIPAYVLSVAVAGICGDGALNIGEQCGSRPGCRGRPRTPPASSSPAAATPAWTRVSSAIPAWMSRATFCDAACQFIAGCGNNRIDEGEECDDGNAVAGDGCDAARQVEVFDLIRGIELRGRWLRRRRRDTFPLRGRPGRLEPHRPHGRRGWLPRRHHPGAAGRRRGRPWRPDRRQRRLRRRDLLRPRRAARPRHLLPARGRLQRRRRPGLPARLPPECDVSGGAGTYDGPSWPRQRSVRPGSGGVVHFETATARAAAPATRRLTVFAFHDVGERVQLPRRRRWLGPLPSPRRTSPRAATRSSPTGSARAIAAYVPTVEFAGECGNGTFEIGEQCDPAPMSRATS
ncbi:MAG: hypothetical protein R3F43_03470 [bacterium]